MYQCSVNIYKLFYFIFYFTALPRSVMVRLLRFGPPYCSTSDQIKESLRSILSCARLSIGRLASIVFVFFFQNTFKKKKKPKIE